MRYLKLGGGAILVAVLLSLAVDSRREPPPCNEEYYDDLAHWYESVLQDTVKERDALAEVAGTLYSELESCLADLHRASWAAINGGQNALDKATGTDRMGLPRVHTARDGDAPKRDEVAELPTP
jgi:hypothetical protein